jgi:hypothetical protein
MSDFHLSDATTRYNHWLHSKSLDSLRQKALDSPCGCSCEIFCVESSLDQTSYFSILLCIIEKKHSITDLLVQMSSVKNEITIDWRSSSLIQLVNQKSNTLVYARKDDFETSAVILAGRGSDVFKQILAMYWCLRS